MSKYSALVKRASNATAALALTVASLTPAVMIGGSAKAAVITERSINMESSAPGAVTNWTVNLGATWNGLGVSVQVCDSPLFDVTCYNPLDDASSTGGAHDGNPAAVTYSSKTEGVAFSATNPNMVGTFYARITRGSDTGSVALSTTNDLTINARVQEQLEFCVGSVTDGDTIIANCAASEFSSAGVVDLGVVDSGADSISPVNNAVFGGNDKDGVFMIRTNATNGAVVSYTNSGHLRVSADIANDASEVNDAFINASNSAFGSAGEKFGMTVKGLGTGTQSTVTNNLTINYAGYSAGNYSWEEIGTQTAIADTNGDVCDYEFAKLGFAARAAATTPTGSYTTTANYVATATF